MYFNESKTYFGKVTGFVERVRKYSAQTSGFRAKWNDQQARYIDELGTLNIDQQLIDYGADFANLLRGDALMIRTGNIEAGEIKAAQGLGQPLSGVGSAGFGFGGFGGVGDYSNFGFNVDPNTSVDYQSVTNAQAAGAANSDYRSTLSANDKVTVEIRRAMTAKFNVQF